MEGRWQVGREPSAASRPSGRATLSHVFLASALFLIYTLPRFGLPSRGLSKFGNESVATSRIFMGVGCRSGGLPIPGDGGAGGCLGERGSRGECIGYAREHRGEASSTASREPHER